MAGYKGIGIVFVRQRIRAASSEDERRLLAGLTEEEALVYASASATEWVSIELAEKVFVLAASILFPGDPSPVRRIGRELAEHNLSGAYRYVVRVLTVPFLVEQSATLWRKYHVKGTARAVVQSARAARFEVTGYPELPERLREVTSGWIAQAVEMTGAKNVHVTKSREEDPERWVWSLGWRC